MRTLFQTRAFSDSHAAKQWLTIVHGPKFEWSTSHVGTLRKWTKDPEAQGRDLAPSAIAEGASLNQSYWKVIDGWWERFPESFETFWSWLREHPRQTWSPAALDTIEKHAYSKEALYDIAFLNDEGRYWILHHPEHVKRLIHMDDAKIQQWALTTTYSAQHIDKAFYTLKMLHTKGHMPVDRIISALVHVLKQIDNHSDPSSLQYRAWMMGDKQLNAWLDEDKELPWWFDPVNRNTWLTKARHWAQDLNWKAPAGHLLQGS